MMRVLHFALWLALQGNSPTSSVASMTSLALPVDMSSRPRSASSLSVGVACRLSHCFVPVSWHGCSRSSWCVPASSAFISRSCRIFLVCQRRTRCTCFSFAVLASSAEVSDRCCSWHAPVFLSVSRCRCSRVHLHCSRQPFSQGRLLYAAPSALCRASTSAERGVAQVR